MQRAKDPNGRVGPITAEQIDKRFHALEQFAADSWSNIKIVDRIRELRIDVRRLSDYRAPIDP